MNRNQAFLILGLQSDAAQEEVMERLDAEVFAVRDHFIRQPVIPELYRSRVDRLVQLSDVSRAMDIRPLGAPVELPQFLPHGENLQLLVRNHIENMRRLKSSMAGTLDPDILARFGMSMTNLQLRYMEGFLEYTGQWALVSDDLANIPAREASEWQVLLDAIQDGGITAQSAVAKERKRIQVMWLREMSS